MTKIIVTLIIWIVCLSIIVVGAALTYTWYKNLGPIIKISFKDGDDLIPDQSHIRFRGVEVGIIKAIEYDQASNRIIISARITRQAMKYLGKDSQFWIVKPRLSFDQVSNLSTLVTGDYIAVNPIKGSFVNNFIGLEEPPINPDLASSLKIYLRSNELEGLTEESPILYHGLQIGEIGAMGLTQDKRAVLITAYIYKQFANVVRRNSTFANISGLHASFHLFGGSHFDMESIRTLMRGGISVTTPNFNLSQAKVGDVFGVLTAAQVRELEEES